MKKIIRYEDFIKIEAKNPQVSIVDVYAQDTNMHDEFLDSMLEMLQK